VRVADIDETPKLAELPTDYVTRLACEKAQAVINAEPNLAQSYVLAGDTIVACDDKLLGKPRDKSQAFAMWQLLSGREHQVLTAMALMHDGVCHQALSTSTVCFKSLSEDEMQHYWSSGEPQDKAGGYAIQGMAACWISEIRGSYSGIMGLDLFSCSQLLAKVGINIL
jgi:septum formation protein